MTTVIALAYLVGMLVIAGVQRYRLALSQRGTLSLGTIAMSLPWFLVSVAKLFVRQAVLGVWLATDRPASPCAAERTNAGGMRVRRVPAAERMA